MRILTAEEKIKIDLIDAFFSSIDSQHLKDFVECEQIVAKLKGGDLNNHVLSNLFNSHYELKQKIQLLESELYTLKNDLSIVVKAVNKPFDPSVHTDFNILKNRFGFY